MTEPFAEIQDATVAYGPVVAVRSASLSVGAGEIVALLGENGAGKSTLVSALYGLTPLQSGKVLYAGKEVTPSPERAIQAGIGMVHQHFMLVPPLTVAENVVLGMEPRRHRFLLDQKAAREQVLALAELHGLPIDPDRKVESLTVGEAQRVEILKVLYRKARLLILDEPTAVLSASEVAHLLAVLRKLAKGGGGVLIITHKLDEVMEVADRVVVLRRGQVVASFPTKGVTPSELAVAMVGREVAKAERTDAAPVDLRAEPALVLSQVSVTVEGMQRVKDVSLSVRKGEIVGIAGVEGNGQSELCGAIAGMLPATGTLRIAGELQTLDKTSGQVAARKRAGLGVIPEDRHKHGIVLKLPLWENTLLGGNLKPGVWILRRGPLVGQCEQILDASEVRPGDPFALAGSLSGGNQQKLIVGRTLFHDPKVLLCSQPTRGVDIGAIESIHKRILLARQKGCAVLLLSSELSELLELSDRILVMYRGRLVGEVANPPENPASRAVLGELMTGAGS